MLINILENALYHHFLGYSLLGSIIVTVKPGILFLMVLITVGHCYFGIKILQALIKHLKLRSTAQQQLAAQSKKPRKMQILVAITLLSQLMQFTLYVAEMAAGNVMMAQIHFCLKPNSFLNLLAECSNLIQRGKPMIIISASQTMINALMNTILSIGLLCQ